jgi:hypothetical protein
MKKTIIFGVTVFITVFASAQQQPQSNATAASSKNSYNHSQFSYKIIDAANKTFGYDIYPDNRLLIHQPSIPAIQGNEGFAKQVDAEKVAKLVIDKLKQGEMPPTISTEELKKLGVIK